MERWNIGNTDNWSPVPKEGVYLPPGRHVVKILAVAPGTVLLGEFHMEFEARGPREIDFTLSRETLLKASEGIRVNLQIPVAPAAVDTSPVLVKMEALQRASDPSLAAMRQQQMMAATTERRMAALSLTMAEQQAELKQLLAQVEASKGAADAGSV